MIPNRGLQQSADQARSEADALKRDQDHYKQTIDLITKQTDFLEGHVSQLTQRSRQSTGGHSGGEDRTINI